MRHRFSLFAPVIKIVGEQFGVQFSERGIPHGQMVPQVWDVPSTLISVSWQNLQGLVKRGLVVKRPHAESGAEFYGLTDKGIEVAKNLNIDDYKKPVYTEADWDRDHDEIEKGQDHD